MATRRRSRRKSIAGNITDVQKRLRYLETRPAPTQLASKVVVSKNIAPRAVGQELIADSAITRRSLTPGVIGTTQIEASSITQGLLATDSVGTDQIKQDSVTANEIAPGTITSSEMGTDSVTSSQILNGSVGTDELAGGIPDSKIAGMSASKLIGNVLDSQISSISASKVSGVLADGNIPALSTSKITSGTFADSFIPNLGAGKITSGVFSDARIPAITADKIPSLDASKIGSGTLAVGRIPGLPASQITSGGFASSLIPPITNAMLAGGITNGKIDSVNAATIITGTMDINRLPGSLLTDVNATSPVTVSGSGRSRTIGINTASFALSSHTHSGYASSGRYDTSFAGGHVGHGGHTHFTNISSTRKLKKEISDYSIDLDKLFLLQPKRFKYRNQARDASKNREWDYGYIAEEALELGVEEIVGYDEKGEVDSINYGLLSVFVLELVKKQQNEINFLSEEIKRLKENK
jgi:hypothetical protein